MLRNLPARRGRGRPPLGRGAVPGRSGRSSGQPRPSGGPTTTSSFFTVALSTPGHGRCRSHPGVGQQPRPLDDDRGVAGVEVPLQDQLLAVEHAVHPVPVLAPQHELDPRGEVQRRCRSAPCRPALIRRRARAKRVIAGAATTFVRAPAPWRCRRRRSRGSGTVYLPGSAKAWEAVGPVAVRAVAESRSTSPPATTRPPPSRRTPRDDPPPRDRPAGRWTGRTGDVVRRVARLERRGPARPRDQHVAAAVHGEPGGPASPVGGERATVGPRTRWRRREDGAEHDVRGAGRSQPRNRRRAGGATTAVGWPPRRPVREGHGGAPRPSASTARSPAPPTGRRRVSPSRWRRTG